MERLDEGEVFPTDAVAPDPSQRPRIFVCGPTAFVERAAEPLVELGHDRLTIHAERFGPTGS